ncbi:MULTISPECIES: SDR family oxidoreductase [Sphingobium]|mgnify:CR=1 FL=1|uniref:SDR family oxidoreductase n=1 Tax=Sphingobium TaxID=165695 RepID=UPI00082CFC9F|nr:SDR family oxidoreductase [Sphingobium cloacae]|tara:strand:+ start:3043 stop:3936 length:894 start_codon:yes stop_codon:yes gene_type:complete
MSDTQRRLLVTGASGHLGHRIVERLLESGQTNVVAATRSPEKLADLAERGVLTVASDFDRPETLDAAFANVDGLLIVSTDALGVPGQRQRQHLNAVEAAVRAGVRHIVYTSMPNPEPGSLIPFAPDHHATEQAIEQSGIPFTILRVNWYAEAVHLWLPQALKTGTWFSSAGEGCVPYIAREDVARAAAAALSRGVAEGRLNVTGPAALTTAQIADIVNTVFDASIAVVSVSDEELERGLLDVGLPGPLVELLVAMDANTRAGGVDVVSDAVERLTGTPARGLREFLAEQRTALAQGA